MKGSMLDIIKQAEMFATAAHKGANHKRKITGIDYIVHPKEVVDFTRHYFNVLDLTELKDEAIAAAWLHDTVEDTGIGFFDLSKWFGEDVTTFVSFLTDDKSVTDREERNLATLKRLSGAPIQVQIIKVADITSNFEDIRRSHMNTNPALQFKNYERFVKEKTEILNALCWVKDSVIVDRLLQNFEGFLASKKNSS